MFLRISTTAFLCKGACIGSARVPAQGMQGSQFRIAKRVKLVVSRSFTTTFPCKSACIVQGCMHRVLMQVCLHMVHMPGCLHRVCKGACKRVHMQERLHRVRIALRLYGPMAL